MSIFQLLHARDKIIISKLFERWLYLEPVFNRGALLKDAGRFRRLDADFRFIITEIKRDSRVTSILRISNLRSLVTSLLDQVGRCQKSLFEFLEASSPQEQKLHHLHRNLPLNRIVSGQAFKIRALLLFG